ncbi:uncharacterized protein LOC144903113 [Branchiostoma floridae x Branchiostoma belcheri]
MKLLLVAVILSFAAYAASQETVNCFTCKADVGDSILGGITGNNPCLKGANDANSTVQTISCEKTAKCYTKIRTIAKYAYSIERGCWTNYDDKGDDNNCDEAQKSSCNSFPYTNTCFKCCNTNKCNANFAQLDGVKNGVTGTHIFSVLALLPVAVAMFL